MRKNEEIMELLQFLTAVCDMADVAYDGADDRTKYALTMGLLKAMDINGVDVGKAAENYKLLKEKDGGLRS